MWITALLPMKTMFINVFKNVQRNADNAEIFKSFNEETYLDEIRERNSKDEELKNNDGCLESQDM